MSFLFFLQMGRLSNKVAIITGCGSGIGLEACFLFAKEGCKVVACDINETTGQNTVKEINKIAAGSTIFVKVDVSKEMDIKNAVAVAEKEFGIVFPHSGVYPIFLFFLGKLNIIFNNAGIMHPADDNAETTEEKIWDLTMTINVKGVWWGCKYAIPAIRRAGGGSVTI